MANTNGMEGVPWMIGGGAKHSADVGRTLAHIAAGGREGVVEPGDWKVSATTPNANAQVHVAKGAGAIRNRSANAESQSYTARALSVSDLDISLPAAAPRSDLVVLRIKDPQFAPWQPYAAGSTERQNGPYAFPEIIPGVPAGIISAAELGLSQSLYAVARIDVPAGQSQVQQSWIKDLRQLIKAEREEVQLVSGVPPAGGENLTSAAFARWITPASFTVKVPSWATHYIARLDVLNSIMYGPNGFGVLGLYAGNTLVASNPYAVLAGAGTSSRSSIQSAISNGELAAPTPGQNVTFSLYGRRDSDSSSGYLSADAQTRAVLNITWLQRVV